MNTVNKRGRKKKEADYNNVFSVRLRELINEKDVTQQQISENITASRQALNKWVNGETIPDIFAAAELADYFGVSLDYLTGRGTVKSSDPDIVGACKITGLSEQAVGQLRFLKVTNDIEFNPKTINLNRIDILNMLLCQPFDLYGHTESGEVYCMDFSSDNILKIIENIINLNVINQQLYSITTNGNVITNNKKCSDTDYYDKVMDVTNVDILESVLFERLKKSIITLRQEVSDNAKHNTPKE